MKTKPDYFERVRLRAQQRWEQLEGDPELAGPWHQLFKQVQSPRHVLSELLQNADDAGATEACVRINDEVFNFEHNGEDFTKDHFTSLCRFGYSNKRALHTIGFRGIGFKSTFSLGDCVELSTPTLSVSFDRKRFTEPRWLPDVAHTNTRTTVRVLISDQHRRKELEKNLEEWLKSPVSLLFFKNIRRLQVGNLAVHWRESGIGPVPDSEWIALDGKKDDAFLLLRSQAEPFPDEALVEIRQERMLNDENMQFPPCRIEMLLGAEGRLFVVLPTGVKTELPFACNAPFIQDPARLKIKDPETSPTNRWLLQRAGALAASAMLRWLGQELPEETRAKAYGLLPDIKRQDNSLEGTCGTIVQLAFAEGVDSQPLLLTDEKKLVCKGESISIPEAIMDIWPAGQAAALLDEDGRSALSRHIASADRAKLVNWNLVKEIDKHRFLGILRHNHLPTPAPWRQLLKLWEYVAPELTGNRFYLTPTEANIVPVQGKDVLYAASEVVRLGEKKLLQSEEDWDFLAKHLVVMNQNWARFLAEQRRSAENGGTSEAKQATESAYLIFQRIGLNDASDVSKVIDQVASDFFDGETVRISECIRLAQIAAKLGVTIGNSFRYSTRDRHLRPIKETILVDENGTLEELIPENQREIRMLHADYTAKFVSCSSEEWKRWVSSGQAGLFTFFPLVQKQVDPETRGRIGIEKEARRRGLKGPLGYAFKTSIYVIQDWDFEGFPWTHWKSLAAEDDQIWVKIADRIFSQRDSFWNRADNVRVLHVATTGSRQAVTNEALLPSWILRLRELPCLIDTRGFPHKPGDLLRRTPETESLMDVELFVHSRFDREATRPLLDLLNVQSTPTGPDRLLDCLRALGRSKTPPLAEVEKWYRRLDQMVSTCSTVDFQKIRDAFWTEKLVLTRDTEWVTAKTVFLSSDEEDVPGAPVIRSSVNDFSLWRRLGIAERPTADLAIQWLKTLPSGQALSPDDAKRVRAFLVRHPARIWMECSHWLNLAGEWVPIDRLTYCLSMQSLIAWAHLHPWVKQKTADLQRLGAEVIGTIPFSGLSALSLHVEERFNGLPLFSHESEEREWLKAVGAGLRRVALEGDKETERIRNIAERLEGTLWFTAPGLETIPYIAGTPAGTARRADALWLSQSLFVDELSKGKLAKRVPEEIGKAFGRPDIRSALDYSFERSSEDIRAYLEENFVLTPEPETVRLAGESDVADRELKQPHQSPEGDINKDASALKEKEITAENKSSTEADTGNTQSSADESLKGEKATRATSKPPKPNILERFARAQGFRRDTDQRFFHTDGSWIGHARDARSLWERRTASGDLVRYYWPKDHCLEHEPLQLDADLWGLIDKYPETYALILANSEGSPIEMTGARLRAMRDEGIVTLHPATYRLMHSTRHEE